MSAKFLSLTIFSLQYTQFVDYQVYTLSWWQNPLSLRSIDLIALFTKENRVLGGTLAYFTAVLADNNVLSQVNASFNT